jgi:hypothetical protein
MKTISAALFGAPLDPFSPRSLGPREARLLFVPPDDPGTAVLRAIKLVRIEGRRIASPISRFAGMVLDGRLSRLQRE